MSDGIPKIDPTNNRRFVSSRVESFACTLVKCLCSKVGYGDVSREQCETMISSYDLRTIALNLKRYVKTSHSGTRGPIVKEIQNGLNLSLAIQDMAGMSFDEKNKLIQEAAKRSDRLHARKDELAIEQDFISNLAGDIEQLDAEIGKFLRDTDFLYATRKHFLRRRVDDDHAFQEALEGLDEIFSRHIRKAMELGKT